MRITPILKTVQDYVPKLISRFSSIAKNSNYQGPGKAEPAILSDSKDVAAARKSVKDAFYTFVDTQYSGLETTDIIPFQKSNSLITISPKEFDTLISKVYTEIRPIFETFLTEKKMSVSLSKLIPIVVSGLLIEFMYKKETVPSKRNASKTEDD